MSQRIRVRVGAVVLASVSIVVIGLVASGAGADPCASYNTTATGFPCPVSSGGTAGVPTGTSLVHLVDCSGTPAACPTGITWSSGGGFSWSGGCPTTGNPGYYTNPISGYEFDTPHGFSIFAGNGSVSDVAANACLSFTNDYFLAAPPSNPCGGCGAVLGTPAGAYGPIQISHSEVEFRCEDVTDPGCGNFSTVNRGGWHLHFDYVHGTTENPIQCPTDCDVGDSVLAGGYWVNGTHMDGPSVFTDSGHFTLTHNTFWCYNENGPSALDTVTYTRNDVTLPNATGPTTVTLASASSSFAARDVPSTVTGSSITTGGASVSVLSVTDATHVVLNVPSGDSITAGSGLTVNFKAAGGCTADYFFEGNGGIKNVTLDSNLFKAAYPDNRGGPSYCLYAGGDAPSTFNVGDALTNNVFEKGSSGFCGGSGAVNAMFSSGYASTHSDKFCSNKYDDNTAISDVGTCP